MNILFFRICMMFELLLIFLSKYNPLYFYWAVLFICVEILNHQKTYKNHAYSWNLIYFCYIIFITLERGLNRFSKYYGYRTKAMISKNLDAAINIGEHIAFAVVICSLLYFFILAFSGKIDNKLRLNVKIIVLFSVIGVLNEVVQNIFSAQLFYVFSEDSVKDIVVNCIGALVYLLFFSSLLRRKTNTI